ncbi:MAG TPA: isopentenyl-diphosphate Delta-isomerase [Puia sp.]|nr:isopentenyl-diphosphate Delta-isomerase [Puia sp.]
MQQEELILVNELDEPVGVMEKMEAHKKGLLHRAFSVFIFNDRGEMLLQQRAPQKYHSANLWTNACCSHPRPGEDTGDAAVRRLNEELGFTAGLKKIFDFTYRTEFTNGLTEFEFDHVFVGNYNRMVHPDKSEVSDHCFKGLDEIRADLGSHPAKYTAWFHLAFPMVMKWIGENQFTL